MINLLQLKYVAAHKALWYMPTTIPHECRSLFLCLHILKVSIYSVHVSLSNYWYVMKLLCHMRAIGSGPSSCVYS